MPFQKGHPKFGGIKKGGKPKRKQFLETVTLLTEAKDDFMTALLTKSIPKIQEMAESVKVPAYKRAWVKAFLKAFEKGDHVALLAIEDFHKDKTRHIEHSFRREKEIQITYTPEQKAKLLRIAKKN